MPRILLADDNKTNRYYLEKILSNAGYNVTALKDGKELIEAFEKQKPDLIITDVHMPVLNGFGAVETLRLQKDSDHIPIIFISATYKDMKSKVKGIDLGANDYLPSPIDEDELLVKVKSMIKYKQMYEELKKTKEELQKAADNWQITFDSTSDVIWLLDKESRVLQSNKASEKIFGRPNEELLGKHCWEIVHGTNEPIPECPFLRVKKSLQRESMELKLGDKWFLISVDPILDSNGKFDGAVHIIGDITERKQIEKALLMKDFAVASSINAIGITELNGTIIYVNEAAVKMWGYKNCDEIIGRQLPEFWEGDGIYQTIKILETKGFRVGEDTAKRKDGSVFPMQFSASVVKDNDGSPIYIFGSFIDITEKKHAEDELRLHSKLLTNMDEGVYLIRASDGIIVYTNPSLERMFGYTPGEMIGKHVATVNAPTGKDPEKTSKEIIDVLNKTGKWEGEVNNIKKDGTTFWCYAIVSTFDHHEHGQVWISAHTDISARMKAEEELRLNEEKLRVLFDNSFDLISLSDVNAKTIWANPQWKKFFGEKGEYDANVFDKIHPNDRENVANSWNKLVTDNSSIENLEYKYKMPNSIYSTFESTAFSVNLQDDKFFYIIARDITVRVKAEKELKKHRDHLEKLVKERTTELEEKNVELEKFNKLFVGREFRVKELKDQVKKLEEKLV
jgi:PAS domain S-box-containing protein